MKHSATCLYKLVNSSNTFESDAVIVTAGAYTLCDDSVTALPGREFDCRSNDVDHPNKIEQPTRVWWQAKFLHGPPLRISSNISENTESFNKFTAVVSEKPTCWWSWTVVAIDGVEDNIAVHVVSFDPVGT